VAQVRRRQLRRRRRGPLDQVGDPEAESEQLVLLVGDEHPVGEAGAGQDLPEAVAGPGEVPAELGGAQPGVDAAEQDPQTGRDHVGDGPVTAYVDGTVMSEQTGAS
jgi:hypothetical protein